MGSHIRATAIISAVTVGMAGSVLAQSGQEQMPMMGRGMMGDQTMNCPMMGGRAMGMMGRKNAAAVVEGRLAYAKVELGISEQQAQAWKEYEDATRASVQGSPDQHQDMMDRMRPGSPVERLDKEAAGLERGLRVIQALKPATEKLYQALTAEQRRKADRILRTE